MIKVEKRDKRLVNFDPSKIVVAITKAMSETELGIDERLAKKIASKVNNEFNQLEIVNIEQLQDYIEVCLMQTRPEVARQYILYRNERAKLRTQGWEMTDLQKDIYEQKYRFENESFDEFLDRVSGGNSVIKKAIKDKKFIPAGRILAGRGLDKLGRKITLSNCYVLPKVEDNIESIFDTAKHLARTYSYGGGVGLTISKLRPRGAKVNNAANTTTGAVSFMDLYSMVTGLIGMRGRRGALMLNLDVIHPDIEEFLDVKNDLSKVTSANISVNVNDDFMDAVKNNKEYELYFKVESTGEEIHKTVDAKKLFNKLAVNNFNMAEPGILYQNRINSWHLMSEDDEFEFAGVNPCFTGDMKLLTDKGYETFEDLDGKKVSVVNINGEITNGKVWCSGEKETIRLTLSNNEEITCTPNHVFMDINENEYEAKDLKGMKIMPYTGNHKLFDDEYVKYGFIQGDGCLGRLISEDHKGLEVNIGEKDNDILFLFRNDEFTKGDKYIYLQGNYKNKLIQLGFDDSNLPDRKFPSAYDDWTHLQKSSFLQGCYSANGSIITNYRVSYKTTSKEFAEKLVETLADDFDINAYITTNKAKEVEFNNGTYLCKESYDINIGCYKDIQKFHNEINFYHLYKKIALRNLLKHKAPYVRSIKENGIKKVYDFTEPETHWGVVEGYIAHNCAEETLPAFGSCNLSSINLAEFVKNPFTSNATFDMDKFKTIVREGVIYLNEVLDENMNLHPLQQQRDMSRDYRQIGLGVMGTADLFIKLGVKYGSLESIDVIHMVGKVLINEALRQSALLAKDNGAFPKYRREAVLKSPFLLSNADEDVLELIKEHGLRNSQLLTIAPTGSVSTLIGCSNGGEPIFQNSYTRRSESLHEVDTYYKVFTPIVKEYMQANNIVNEDDLPDFFVTTSNLNYRDRIDVQATWQQYIDASISSTVNVPNEFTVEEVEGLYMYAWEQGLKGVTIFRDGCARLGILTTDKPKTDNILDRIDELQNELDQLASEQLKANPDECPLCGGRLIHSGGCAECQDCGYSPCSI